MAQPVTSSECRYYRDGKHHWLHWGMTKWGTLCHPGAQLDVTGGDLRTCECGVEQGGVPGLRERALRKDWRS